MPSTSFPRAALAGAAFAVLAACGGGGGAEAPTATPATQNLTSSPEAAAAAEAPAAITAPVLSDGQPAPLVETTAAVAAPDAAAAPADAQATAVTPAVPTTAERAAAAAATAQSSANACASIRPFYWEIGDRTARLASGGAASGSNPYGASTPMSIASASKWLYGSYVAQRQNGVLSDSDRKFLSMRSGYVSLKSCEPGQTVDQCEASGSNGAYTASADGRFDYDGGHMEKHASLIGLGPLKNATLATEIRNQLGTDLPLAYSQPQLAGGAVTSPDAYARVLRRMLDGTLRMGTLLGSGPVCTNPGNCASAVYAPVPATLSWHYSVAHWVEDDPKTGDGAFSSPGAFGFYPWIDAGKTTYGIVARVAPNGAWPSVRCGQLIRKAWFSGTAQ